MQIGLSNNEFLLGATVLTGTWRWMWQRQLRQLPASPARRPWWAVIGCELFPVVALIFACRVAVIDWPRVPSGSMEPTLRVGDYLLINHLAYGPRLPFTNTPLDFGQPQRGDVVVFRNPQNVSQFYVKRLVGMPGDVVSFSGGVVAINGAAPQAEVLDDNELAPWHVRREDEDRGQWMVLESASAPEHVLKINPFILGRMALNLHDAGLAAHCRAPRSGEWQCTVPLQHYLMLGDNRDASADSREWGFLPHDEVYGKAVRVLFNLQHAGRTWLPL